MFPTIVTPRQPIDSVRRIPAKRSRLVVGGVLAATLLLAAACGDDEATTQMEGTATSAGGAMNGDMGEGMDTEAPRVPPVFGYYDGNEIFFVHTEASDPDIASALEGMMASPVPVVAALADVPDEALGTVYVFTNGVKPDDTPLGPLNFQPDVFDSAPGDTDYSPLRRIAEVTWSDEVDARLLTSAEEIDAAEADGELTVDATDAVINAPFLTWPDGQR